MNLNEWLQSLQGAACPTFTECKEYLGIHIPLLHQLKSTPQDKEWHSEGDVENHTQMMLDELYNLIQENKQISGKRRQSLILAAILHDVAKPVTTKKIERDQQIRTVAPRHETVGRSIVTYQLIHLPLEYDVIHTILALVGEHGKPKKLAKTGNRVDFLALSRLVDMELLYLLELADMKGRVAADKAETVETIELFRLFAQEYNCWDNDVYFCWSQKIAKISNYKGNLLDATIAKAKQDRESSIITTPEEAIARSYTLRDGFPEVLLFCGISGSGKSTFIQKRLKEYTIISLDEIRKRLFGKEQQQGNHGKVLQEAKEELRKVLRVKGKAVWDATSLRKDFRSMVIDLTHDYKGLVTTVFVHSTIPEAQKGNASRLCRVSNEILDKQIRSFEYPTIDESDRQLIVNHKGEILYSYGFTKKVTL